MENELINFIGIDVAKATLDVAVIKNNQRKMYTLLKLQILLKE